MQAKFATKDLAARKLPLLEAALGGYEHVFTVFGDPTVSLDRSVDCAILFSRVHVAASKLDNQIVDAGN